MICREIKTYYFLVLCVLPVCECCVLGVALRGFCADMLFSLLSVSWVCPPLAAKRGSALGGDAGHLERLRPGAEHPRAAARRLPSAAVVDVVGVAHRPPPPTPLV